MEDFNAGIRFDIKGLRPFERAWAEQALFSVYNGTVELMNNGGIDKYNADWDCRHPEKDSTTVLEDEYTSEYEKLFKMEADKVALKQGKLPMFRRIAKLREFEPVIFTKDLKSGVLSGYVESY